MKKVEFIKGKWEDLLEHAYSYRFKCKPKLVQEENCIVNSKNPDMEDGYDYVTLVTKDMYGEGSVLSATCSFEHYGAPLFTLTDLLERDADGDLRYGRCYEVVLWEKGINVWQMYMDNDEVKWHSLLRWEEPMSANEKHKLCVEIMDKDLKISVDGKTVQLRISDLPKQMYLGITACEGINRYYDMSVDNK